MAQKEEAYFKMLVPEDSQAAKMKDDSSGLVDSRLIWSLLNCAPVAFARFSSAQLWIAEGKNKLLYK